MCEKKGTETDPPVLDESRPWADLPVEILATIADRLPLIELFAFRGTCKDFRLASSRSTAKTQSSRTPWLLFHKPNTPNFLIYNEPESKTYHRDIPELNDAVILASYQGWLLLSKHESIFFFNPFSLTKITLPDLPSTHIIRPNGPNVPNGPNGPNEPNGPNVAAFSDIPTSPDCIISIISPILRANKWFFEIALISKGQKTWTTHLTHGDFDTKPTISGATFDHLTQTFYYMYHVTKLCVLKFSATDKKWTPYTVVHREKSDKDSEVLPYVYRENMFVNSLGKIKDRLGVEDDEGVDVCGLTIEPGEWFQRLYLNESVNDSKSRSCKAVWVQPRFFEVGSDQLRW